MVGERLHIGLEVQPPWREHIHQEAEHAVRYVSVCRWQRGGADISARWFFRSRDDSENIFAFAGVHSGCTHLPAGRRLIVSIQALELRPLDRLCNAISCLLPLTCYGTVDG